MRSTLTIEYAAAGLEPRRVFQQRRSASKDTGGLLPITKIYKNKKFYDER